MRIFTVILVLLLTAPLIHAQQPAKQAKEGASQQRSAVSAEDAQAMREELQQMKSLVYQMERNLASISSAQDPLKHQFQLEVDMWQLQIASMERRLGTATEPK